ncbi:MAG: ABC transporter permease [Salinarchaeum sp.]
MSRIAPFLRRTPSVLMAWRNLGRNRIRTALATLGIVIGVIAIAGLGMTGVALQQQATSNLGGLTNQISVTSGADSPEDGVTTAQVADIRNLVVDAEVVPQRTDRTTLSTRSGAEQVVSVTALSEASVLYDPVRGATPDRLRAGALIGQETATRLNLEVGDPVEYDDTLYRIQGIVTPQQGFGGGAGLVLPQSALDEEPTYDSVTVVATSGSQARAIADAIDAEFNEADEQIVSVTDYASVQENIGSFFSTLNLALLGIGLISLVVASVAILNVMLMSTIERRGEIGVLRAVGIRRGEVLRMILAEAVFLGVLGGIVGAGLSLAIGAVLFAILTDSPWLVFGWSSAQYLLYGFAFAVVASLLSGLYPAWKAANDPPVEALRG